MMRDGTGFSCWLLSACWLLAALTFVSLPPLSAQENENGLRRGSTSAARDNLLELQSEENINSLILMLGADDYSTRIIAEKKLMKLGGLAIAPLKDILVAGQTHIESEIRFRAERLLVLLERDDFKTRRHEFLALENDDVRELGFSGWRQFSTICGSNRNSRQMFLGMYQSHPQLFQSIGLGSAAVERKIKAGAASAIPVTSAAQRIDSINTTMFLQSIRLDHSDKIGFDLGWGSPVRVCGELNRADIVAFVQRGDHRPEIEALIEFWLNQKTTAELLGRKTSSVNARLELTRNYRLLGQSPFLFGLIDNKDLPVQTRAKSLAVLSEVFAQVENGPAARIGSAIRTADLAMRTVNNSGPAKTDVRSGRPSAEPTEDSLDQNSIDLLRRHVVNRLKPLLADPTLFGHFPNSDANLQMLEVQFRDIVLAACVKISNHATNDLGWDYEFFLDSSLKKRRFAFANDSMRKKAIETWLLLNK